MMLNIINFNPDINKDKEILKNLNLIFENIDKNISSKKYIPYQNILYKFAKFIDMIKQNFEKDIKKIEDEENYFDESKDDDDISISSISEYEYEESDDEIEVRNIEDKLIKQFEKNNKLQFIKTYERFDFEYE